MGLGRSLPFDDFVPFKLGGGGDFHLGSPGLTPEVFLLGDSHAGALQYGLDVVLRESNRGGYVINRGATEMFDLRTGESKYAVEWLASQTNLSTVVLAQRWRLYNNPQMFLRLIEFAHRIEAMGKTLYLVADVPSYNVKRAPSDIAARVRIIPPRQGNSEVKQLRQSESEYNRVEAEINRHLDEVCRKTGASLIPLNLAFKQDDRYIAFAQQNGKTIPLYCDYNHVSPDGSVRAARFLVPYLFPQDRSHSASRD
jgi:hypothetical protein